MKYSRIIVVIGITALFATLLLVMNNACNGTHGARIPGQSPAGVRA